MKRVYLFITTLMISVSFVNAQNLYDVVYTIDKLIPSYLPIKNEARPSLKMKSKGNAYALNNILHLNDETTAELIDTLTDIAGGFHESYVELYKGIVSPKSFPHLPWLEIVPDRKVYLQSDDFIDADITKTATGMFPAEWSNNNGVISFTPIMAVNSNVGTITINGTYPNSCRHFNVRLRAFGELDVEPMLLTVNPSGQTYTFSLSQNKDLDSSSSGIALPEEWQLEIVRSENGMKVFDTKVFGPSKVIDTTGWKPGVYIAVAQLEKESLTVKFVVENRSI